MIKIKAFDEMLMKCGVLEQYSEDIEKLGELNFQRMSKDATGMVISFEEIIKAICEYRLI